MDFPLSCRQTNETHGATDRTADPGTQTRYGVGSSSEILARERRDLEGEVEAGHHNGHNHDQNIFQIDDVQVPRD